MARKKTALLLGICFALVACADSATNRGVTAPAAQPSLAIAAAPADALSPVDSDESIPLAAAIGIEQAATGGRASGHWELNAPLLGILTERYSFVALSTGTPPSAKGQLQGHITSLGRETDIHVEVDCLVIDGNKASISGPLKKLVTNGVPQPTEGRYSLWQVQDNGEGADSPADIGSLLFQAFPQACAVGFILPMTPDGNIQVSEK